jgi:16S rRNA G1207 methylase RsmC
VWSRLGIKQESISKITKVKRADVVIQMVERLPSKHEVLSSILSTAKKKKNFSISKDIINKVKQVSYRLENIFTNLISNNELVSAKHKELLPHSIKKTNNQPYSKWVNYLNKHHTKKDTPKTKTHMKRYSTSLLIRELQIKMRYTPILMGISE